MRMDELLDEIYAEEANLLQLENEEADMKDTLLRQERLVLQKIREEQSENRKGENRKEEDRKNIEIENRKQKRSKTVELENFSEETIHKSTPKRKRIKKKRLFLILAAAVMMFGSVVSASRYYDLDIRLEKMVGSSNVMKDLSGGFVEVGVSDTDDNITITATQAIGDKNSQWIVLDTNIPWTVGEEGYYMIADTNFDFSKRRNQATETCGYYVEPYNNNGLVSFLVSAEVEGINRLYVSLNCQTIMVEYEGGERHVVSDGSWKLEWKNKYTGNAHTIYPMKMAEFKDDKGNSFTGLVYKIEFSPLIIRAEIVKNPMEKSNTQLENIEITSVTLKDGTVLPARMSQSGSSNNTFLDTSISYESMGKVNLSEVETITVGGVEIELD